MVDVDWADMAIKVGSAIVIIIVTWIIAGLVKWGLGKLIGRIPALNRQGDGGRSLGRSLGTVGSLIVWIFGLVAVLQVFRLVGVLDPIQKLLGTIMGYLPNIIAAAFIFFIGYLIAKILKQIIETVIGAVNMKSIVAKAKKIGPGSEGAEVQAAGSEEAESTTGLDASKIGSLVGNIVFAVILISVSIVALQALNISVISDPAKHMLHLILDAVPMILAGAVLLGIGFLIARFIGSILESTLRGLGTDRAATSLGILSEERSASTILTRIAQVAIMVFFAIMAAEMLNFPQITDILDAVLALAGQVLFGAVIIGVGFLIARIVANAIGDGTVAKVARYSIIALFVAMGLKYMGIADSIITLAFGAIVVGAALTGVLAFGLGGRGTAARWLEEKRTGSSATSGSTTSEDPPA